MKKTTSAFTTVGEPSRTGAPPADPCILVIFGASGDLTRRLLMPALYNLACDGLLPRRFAVVGIAGTELSTEQFRQGLSDEIQGFCTRKTFDAEVWQDLARRFHYTSGDFSDPDAYRRLGELIGRLDAELGIGGNVIFYLATPPSVFAMVARGLHQAGLRGRAAGWTRLIVEKPFGHDLQSADHLSRELLACWPEQDLYRIDHYLGKETVQNLLAFRFANGIYEPVWNKTHIDHIQFTVAETVGVEGRGRYYDHSGVLRDMIQNHMFQMLAYLCMEPPSTLRADSIRNEKAELLEALRVMTPDEVLRNAVRGQYGPDARGQGVGYRQEPDVDPASSTETFAALRLFIDNWRWEGVPIYLRSGKRLWKRGTEIIVQFKKAPRAMFRGTPAAEALEANQLVFHIQPDQGVEFRFHAKTPGPRLQLQQVNMRFDYHESFEAARGTGYEIMLYHCMVGDATLFSRTDLVESAWRATQPILDTWAETPADFPNYPAGSWGPKEAWDMLDRDGRRWIEVINRNVLETIPLFQGSDPILLYNLAMMLRPVVAAPGETLIRRGDMGSEMYIVCRGRVEVVDARGGTLATLGPGDFFGETSLLWSTPRTATVRATSACDLFVLEREDFDRVLQENPKFPEMLHEVARKRYPEAGH